MLWSVEYPINLLPEDVNVLFRSEANFLYNNLLNNGLIVVLLPAPDPKYVGHMVRYTVSKNPEWYSTLYTHYQNLKRHRSLRALDRIRNQNDQQLTKVPKSAVHTWWTYDTLYRGFILERLAYGYNEYGLFVPPEKKIQDFFQIDKKELSDCLV